MVKWRDSLEKGALSNEALTNRHYYNLIDKQMGLLPKPTVGDAIAAMRAQGNKPYFDAFPELNQKMSRTNFDPAQTQHEISHLCARIGHMPRSEQSQLAFEMGLGISPNAFSRVIMTQKLREGFKIIIDKNVKAYSMTGLLYGQITSRATKMDYAIYIAAGLYLRGKMETFLANGWHAMPYGMQQAFCETYAQSDSQLPLTHVVHFPYESILTAPYDLIRLSEQEWREITAVALNLSDPKDTDYPLRLKVVKEALVKLEYSYDAVPMFERAIKNSADNHPKKEGFDLERFTKAREKRGAPQR